MRKKTWVVVIVIIATAVVVYVLLKNCAPKKISKPDSDVCKCLLRKLDNFEYEDFHGNMLDIQNKILLAKLPAEGENFSFNGWEDAYYSSYPSHGAGYPTVLYNRLNLWSPGFYSGSGWVYYVRPGISHDTHWPNGWWLRHTHGGKYRYYYVSDL